MKEIPLSQIQLMLPSDKLSYELGLIPSPQEIEKNEKLAYILIGVFTTVAVGLMVYTIHQKYQESKFKFSHFTSR